MTQSSREDSSPGDESSDTDAPRKNSATRFNWFSAILWSVTVAVSGGYACGLAIRNFAVVGSISFLLLGWVAGLLGRRYVGGPKRLFGVCLVVSCILAMAVAEVARIRWGDPEGGQGWRKSIELLPVVLRENPLDTVVAAIFTMIGAATAYWQVARR